MSADNNISAKLDALLANDTFLPDIEVKEKTVSSTNPLINTFIEITTFYETHQRLPGAGNKPSIKEKGLLRSLKTIISKPELVEELSALDTYGLLDPNKLHETKDASKTDIPASTYEVKKELTKEDIADLEKRVLDNFDGLFDEEDDDLFSGKNNRTVTHKPEKIAQPEPCLEYEKYKAKFEQLEKDLEKGSLKAIKFRQKLGINIGDYFIYKGLIGLLVSEDEKFIDHSGCKNYRCRVIYNNETEIDYLYQSLVTSMHKDKGGCKIVSSNSNVESDLKLNGYVYVLSTKNSSSILDDYRDNLYKVGVTYNTVTSRIANAEKSTTYLEAPVEIVAEAACYGKIDPGKLEKAIQRMLSSRKLNVSLVDGRGHSYHPKEWFVVPFETIQNIIECFNNGTVSDYYVNPIDGKLIKK